MRITNADVDCLIDVVQVLRELAKVETDSTRFKVLTEQICRVRKVYILLLKASSQGVLNLRWLETVGYDDESNVGKAIRELCPAAFDA